MIKHEGLCGACTYMYICIIYIYISSDIQSVCGSASQSNPALHARHALRVPPNTHAHQNHACVNDLICYTKQQNTRIIAALYLIA